MAFNRGTFRVRGDTVEIIPAYEELAVRIEFFGDEIEALYYLHPLTGEVVRQVDSLRIFPATHYVAGPERMERAVRDIEAELAERLAELERQGKLLEAQRLRMRTQYDLEMIRQVGFCSGIENYSRHIDGRGPGTAPATLIDYFPDDFLLVIDESHVTVPQIGGMYEGDMSRKRNLVEFGFRLPSAVDNRPLTWEEFADRIGQTVYLSATPGPYELHRTGGEFVEQVIRPDRPGRPAGGGQADQGPDRRPRARDPASAPTATSGCWSPRSPRRWPRTSPTTCWSWASGCATCTRRSTRCGGSSCCASCGSASSTCSWASTCSARASTCRRCRWSRSSTPTRRASCARAPR